MNITEPAVEKHVLLVSLAQARTMWVGIVVSSLQWSPASQVNNAKGRGDGWNISVCQGWQRSAGTGSHSQGAGFGSGD